MITDQSGSPLRKGQLPRSIWLPTLAADYAPDGLGPDDIDALITECGLDLTVVDELVEQTYRDANPEPRPVTSTWTSEDRRRRRRTVRRIARAVDAPASTDSAAPSPATAVTAATTPAAAPATAGEAA